MLNYPSMITNDLLQLFVNNQTNNQLNLYNYNKPQLSASSTTIPSTLLSNNIYEINPLLGLFPTNNPNESTPCLLNEINKLVHNENFQNNPLSSYSSIMSISPSFSSSSSLSATEEISEDNKDVCSWTRKRKRTMSKDTKLDRKRPKKGEKNALMRVHELCGGNPEYQIIDTVGPRHEPSFIMKLDYEGYRFIGRGRTKKLSRIQIAERIVQFIDDQLNNEIRTDENCFQLNKSLEIEIEEDKERLMELINDKKLQSIFPIFKWINRSSFQIVVSHRLLNVLKRNNEKFRTYLKLNYHSSQSYPSLFYVTISSDTLKSNDLLAQFIKIVNVQMVNSSIGTSGVVAMNKVELYDVNRSSNTSQKNISTFLQSSLDDLIKNISSNTDNGIKSKILLENLKKPRNCCLSAVIMSENDEYKELVSLATGTKIIQSTNMDRYGEVLLDCHSEIVCQRTFRLFLLRNILVLLNNLNERLHRDMKSKEEILDQTYEDDNSIFQMQLNMGNIKFRLRPNIKFHLCLLASPCGMGRLLQNHRSLENDDVLRCKLSSSSGTTPSWKNCIDIDECLSSQNNQITKDDWLSSADIESLYSSSKWKRFNSQPLLQCWDGLIVNEQKTHIMSCSDKLMKSLYCGIEGSFLSQLVDQDTIRYSSINISEMFDFDNLKKTFFSRMPLVDKEKKREIYLGGLEFESNPKNNDTTTNKTSIHSINWLPNSFEIVNSKNGRKVFDRSDNVSRLSKLSCFKIWGEIKEKLNGIYKKLLNRSSNGGEVDLTYLKEKNRSIHYLERKKELYDYLTEMNYGHWTHSSIEMKLFNLPLSENDL
ncbi:hypothetical protein SNEBB_006941 [Seison nebaliae]|nr:hypothetical protein SNEBB_006941 [Seison nebaliae]